MRLRFEPKLKLGSKVTLSSLLQESPHPARHLLVQKGQWIPDCLLYQMVTKSVLSHADVLIWRQD